nr:MAG TPA: Rad50 zinc hook motif [Caudoviricetes sp.]
MFSKLHKSPETIATQRLPDLRMESVCPTCNQRVTNATYWYRLPYVRRDYSNSSLVQCADFKKG